MKDFILAHRNDDVRQLALQYSGSAAGGMDMQFVLQQIDGWQRARHKLPMWAACDDIIYPPHISMEQCSSEQTAMYKSSPLPTSPRRGGDAITNSYISLPTGETCPKDSSARVATSRSGGDIRVQVTGRGGAFVDLTGGFGVDFSYIARHFEHSVYVERQEHLCDIARHNMNVLGLTGVSIVCADSTDYLKSMKPVDFIYLDPARRDTNGKKTYAIEDCTPDVITLLPLLLEKSSRVMIKLSPMLDHNEAIRRLGGHCHEVHIVSVKNECKEILLLVGRETIDADRCRIVCVNDDSIFEAERGDTAVSARCTDTILPGDRLFVPNASVMKAGLFGSLCQRYDMRALDTNSHLFRMMPDNLENPAIPENLESPKAPENLESPAKPAIPENLPGRLFTVKGISSLNKKELRHVMAGITHANVAVRNFPMSAVELRKRLNVKDGGDTYIFGTTVNGEKKIIISQ